MWSRNRRPLLAVAALAAAFIPLAAAQAGVVVASSGPSAKTYPVGKKLAPADKVVLQPGDTLTVLDEKGTRVFRGPATVSLAASATADRSSAFALLTRQRSAQRVRTGAVRDSLVGPVSRPNLWYVDVRQSGPMCLADPTEVRLWRPVSTGEGFYAIEPVGAKTTAKAAFGDGEMLTVWDLSRAPVTDGARYVVAGKDGSSSEITFRVLDSVPATADELASALIAKGCTSQLEVLSSALTTDDS